MIRSGRHTILAGGVAGYDLAAAQRSGVEVMSAFGLTSATRSAIVSAYGSGVWAKVRDYAKTHPALVPYINEDPDLCCSVVETGWERWLVGDGKAQLVVDYYANNESYVIAEYQVDAFADDLGQSCSIFGSSEAWGKKGYEVLFPVNTITRHNIAWGDTTPQFNITTPLNKTLRIDWNKQSFLYMNLDDNVDLIKTTLSSQTFTSPNKFGIFRSYRGSFSEKSTARLRMKFVMSPNIFNLVPMQSKFKGAGALDLVSLKFYPNANTSGSFTIEKTAK